MRVLHDEGSGAAAVDALFLWGLFTAEEQDVCQHRDPAALQHHVNTLQLLTSLSGNMK